MILSKAYYLVQWFRKTAIPSADCPDNYSCPYKNLFPATEWYQQEHLVALLQCQRPKHVLLHVCCWLPAFISALSQLPQELIMGLGWKFDEKEDIYLGSGTGTDLWVGWSEAVIAVAVSHGRSNVLLEKQENASKLNFLVVSWVKEELCWGQKTGMNHLVSLATCLFLPICGIFSWFSLAENWRREAEACVFLQ